MKTRQGQIDLSGETFGTIEVLRHVRLAPQIAYEVKCKDCGSHWSGFTNQDLKNNPKCQNRGCGKKVFLSWKEEHEHEQAEKFAATESAWKKSLNELAAAERLCMQHAKDDGFQQSAELRSMPPPTFEEAQRFTEAETHKFLANNPSWYACPENHRTLVDFLVRNGIDRYCDAVTFSRAFERLRSYGLLKERPAPPPQPEPETIVEPGSVDPVLVDDDEDGYDEATGERIRKSAYQIRRMSAEQYLSFKRIPIIAPSGPPMIR